MSDIIMMHYFALHKAMVDITYYLTAHVPQRGQEDRYQCCPSLPPVLDLHHPTASFLSRTLALPFVSLKSTPRQFDFLAGFRGIAAKVRCAERAHERRFGGNTMSVLYPSSHTFPNSPTI
jgi:hypothetical protein